MIEANPKRRFRAVTHFLARDSVSAGADARFDRNGYPFDGPSEDKQPDDGAGAAKRANGRREGLYSDLCRPTKTIQTGDISTPHSQIGLIARTAAISHLLPVPF